MKKIIKLNYLLSAILLILILLSNSYSQTKANKNTLCSAKYCSLDLKVLEKGNYIDCTGTIHELKIPLIHLIRSKSKFPVGTILLLPGGGYSSLNVKSEGESLADSLNMEGFDIAILEYHISADGQNSDSALFDALKAYRLVKNRGKLLGLKVDRLDLLGISSGGNLAAKTVQGLALKEQPDNLILISPSNMNETQHGTVYPVVMPPIISTTRLLTTFSVNDNQTWIKSALEYTKTWKGYDGDATFKWINDSLFLADRNRNPLSNNTQLYDLLKLFLNAKPDVIIAGINPAAIAVEGKNKKRFTEKCELLKKEKFDLLMIGNSITNNFEKAQYQPIWNQFFAPRKAVNLGISGYRTENVIWNIENGFLEGQSPKLVVLEIGTNNIDEKNYPTRHTAGQLAGGIIEIVRILRDKLPHAKIIVMRCFPGCYGGPNPTSHRFILERASDIVSKLADGKHIFICDVNRFFLNKDGSINHDMMGDWLHPTPEGAKAWAEAMEPLLSKLMDEKHDQSNSTTNIF